LTTSQKTSSPTSARPKIDITLGRYRSRVTRGSSVVAVVASCQSFL
jgi:hypothetical protein